jgi:hypothetical protein
MSSFEWFLLFSVFILIFSFMCYFIGKSKSPLANKTENMRKGNDAEDLVVECLTNWTKDNSIPARVYRYPASLEFHQHIDIIFDSPVMENLGIEVKFRTIHNGVRELKLDDICHMNSNGTRQTTNQLYSYIKNSGRLGLYAFIFRRNGVDSLYFLPHYILQQIISKKWNMIYVSHITKHPNSYSWSDNSDFSDYVSREFELQDRFLNPRKKADKADSNSSQIEAEGKDEIKKESIPADYIDYSEDFYF